MSTNSTIGSKLEIREHLMNDLAANLHGAIDKNDRNTKQSSAGFALMRLGQIRLELFRRLDVSGSSKVENNRFRVGFEDPAPFVVHYVAGQVLSNVLRIIKSGGKIPVNSHSFGVVKNGLSEYKSDNMAHFNPRKSIDQALVASSRLTPVDLLNSLDIYRNSSDVFLSNMRISPHSGNSGNDRNVGIYDEDNIVDPEGLFAGNNSLYKVYFPCVNNQGLVLMNINGRNFPYKFLKAKLNDVDYYISGVDQLAESSEFRIIALLDFDYKTFETKTTMLYIPSGTRIENGYVQLPVHKTDTGKDIQGIIQVPTDNNERVFQVLLDGIVMDANRNEDGTFHVISNT